MMMRRKLRTRGTDNVLVDLGFDDAEELSAKAMLAMKLNALLEAQGLTQARASKILGMPQPKISAIRNYKLRGISLERLMQALVSLDQSVEIIVRPARRAHGAGITVAA
jgi:predicted XRE-type DNA-binding protein